MEQKKKGYDAGALRTPILLLRSHGISYSEISKGLGISRQRAAQIAIGNPNRKKEKCEECGFRGPGLHFHHKSYWPEEDVIVLCGSCHGKTRMEHSKKKYNPSSPLPARITPSLTCLCCGHSWYPRLEASPKVCPRCKRFNWRTGLGPVTKSAIANQKSREAEAKKRIAAIKSGALESAI